jgi:hypothetical protein
VEGEHLASHVDPETDTVSTKPVRGPGEGIEMLPYADARGVVVSAGNP